ncbi:MAG: radical SAM protein [Dehalococcoidia bacterium]|nr:MAG: radical SAM protein [Dehalococcoidia bacterium]
MRLVIGDPANINNLMVEQGNNRFPNMGILSIFGYLKERTQGLEAHYIRGNLDLKSYLKRLEAIRPEIYGISFASLVSEIAYETIDAVRSRFPGIPIICGGTHPTALPAEVLTRSKADICVIGEGEQTVAELVTHFASGEGELSGINGLAYRENGQIKYTLPRKHIGDLGTLPLPAWDMINFDEYEGLGYCKGTPNTAMIFSRGCPYHCVYCSNPVWRADRPWLRLRPPEDIQKEVALLYQRGIREIWIRADEFNSVLGWTFKVCQAIKELNYKDLFFECNLRADKVTDELAQALRDINVWMINLGIETLNQRVLDGIRKKVTVEQIVGSCKTLKRHGIDVYAWLMYYQIWEENGKLCWETPEEVDNTLRMARRMHREGLIDLMSWQIATPIPGAEMFDIARKFGLISKPNEYNVWKVSTSIPGVKERRVQTQRLKGFLLQAYMAYRKGRVGWSARHNIWNRMRYVGSAIFNILKPRVSRSSRE